MARVHRRESVSISPALPCADFSEHLLTAKDLTALTPLILTTTREADAMISTGQMREPRLTQVS